MIGCNTYLRWQVTVTHAPTGETVTLNSSRYRDQHSARVAAIKLIKARLLSKKNINRNDFSYYSYDIDSPTENLMDIRLKKESKGDVENDTVYCPGCEEEYWLPEDAEACPFCGENL